MTTADPALLEQEGLACDAAGDLSRALECFRQAHLLYAERGDAREMSEMLNDIGVVHYRQRRWAEAEAALREAIEAAGPAHPDKQAQAWGNLGSLYARQGRAAEAEEAYNRAVALFRQIGDHDKAEATLKALSDLSLRRGGWAESALHHERRLAAIPAPNLWQRFQLRLIRALKRLGGL